MIENIKKCDIINREGEHSGEVRTILVKAIFDHDQEDGKSKVEPYFQEINIEMCEGCIHHMMEKRVYVYGFGAMGNNQYSL